jgi:hypothetical protein
LQARVTNIISQAGPSAGTIQAMTPATLTSSNITAAISYGSYRQTELGSSAPNCKCFSIALTKRPARVRRGERRWRRRPRSRRSIGVEADHLRANATEPAILLDPLDEVARMAYQATYFLPLSLCFACVESVRDCVLAARRTRSCCVAMHAASFLLAYRRPPPGQHELDCKDRSEEALMPDFGN